MTKKIIVIGAVGGGATTASQLRKLDEAAEIILLEKTPFLSYGACGMPYYLGDVIQERESLFAYSPEKLQAKKKIDVRMQHEALRIDRDKKTLFIKDLVKGDMYEEVYDALVIATGATPFKPDIKGLESINSFTLRTVGDMDRIKDYLQNEKPTTGAIIGGGFIGVEMAENLTHLGIETSIIERSSHVLSVIDEETAGVIQQHLTEKGVKLHLNTGLHRVHPKNDLVLDDGAVIHADFVILATGIKPTNKIAYDAGLSIGESGGISVNKYMQTDDPSIYAVGDVVESFDLIDGSPKQVPLAWPAHRQSYIAAKHITGTPVPFRGMLGCAIAKVFDMTVASTGHGEKELIKRKIHYKTVTHKAKSHAGYYPGSKDVYVRVHFCPETGRIFGGNVAGGEGVDKQIDVLSTAIIGGLSVIQLQEIETCYAPPYSSPKGLMNMVGYKAESMMK
ncbi:CoA-disulfide reductase [Rossellomorea aquimaris]|uniref:CoA-disulfide reductase n=1 Tax=Rossellomorea aquimaris TaxID=189382 RepID=UPI001CD30B22|nr:CoA-disulfide reductase [Rossellomorea aquimaris]MCA1056768.1 CoA-disulfide reductase [Rossellomorea aquimaris]